MLETNAAKLLYAAYEPEGHDIVVAELQHKGSLFERQVTYVRRRTIVEEGLDWYILAGESRESFPMKLLAFDCNSRLIRNLRRGQVLTEILSPFFRPDLCFGRYERPIAAVLDSRNRPIYKSPGFDLDSYLELRS